MLGYEARRRGSRGGPGFRLPCGGGKVSERKESTLEMARGWCRSVVAESGVTVYLYFRLHCGLWCGAKDRKEWVGCLRVRVVGGLDLESGYSLSVAIVGLTKPRHYLVYMTVF